MPCQSQTISSSRYKSHFLLCLTIYVSFTSLANRVYSFSADREHTYSPSENDAVLKKTCLMFCNAKNGETWWHVKHLERGGVGSPKSSTTWKVRAIAALDSCIWKDDVACHSICLAANLTRCKELSQNDSVVQVVGVPRKTFTENENVVSSIAVLPFLLKCERMVRSQTKPDATISMCASGFEYLFDTQEYMQLALFMTERAEVFFLCGIDSTDEVKASRFVFSDEDWANNPWGTTCIFDSGYSVSAERISEDTSMNTVDDYLKILIHGLRDSKVLIISRKNMKSYYDYLKNRKTGSAWKAERMSIPDNQILF